MSGPVRYRVKGSKLYVRPVAAPTGAVTVTPMQAYAPASRSPRMVRWQPIGQGPNSGASDALGLVRGRARDLVRENGYAQAGVEALVSNIVGAGIKPQFNTKDPEFNKALAEAWLEWTDEADADGRLDFYGLGVAAVAAALFFIAFSTA